MFEIPKLWAGSQASFDLLIAAMDSAYGILESRAGTKDPFELPPLVQVQEGVGVVSIKGPLISGNAGFMRLFGVTGYADIQEALMEAAENKSVKSLLLTVASGGGAVDGADETSEFVKNLGALKPIVTYASGAMASAAYWVGSAGARRLASRTSIVGSIGAVFTHMERSKQLEKDGIGATVIRSGKFKALVNSIEPLSETAKAQMQAMVEAISGIFEERVAGNLGVSTKVVRDRMGQGREFLGADAQAVGLVDGIASIQEAFAVAKLLGRS